MRICSRIYGGDGDTLGALPVDSELFSDFVPEPNGLPPFAAVLAFESLDVDVGSILMEGGTGRSGVRRARVEWLLQRHCGQRRADARVKV